MARAVREVTPRDATVAPISDEHEGRVRSEETAVMADVAEGAAFAALLTEARSGSPAAFASIYLALAGRVQGYLKAQGLSALDAEDLTSDTFAGVAGALERFSGDEQSFRSWVFTIAHHRLFDFRRSQRRRPAAPIDHRDLASLASPDNTEGAAMRSATERAIAELLDELSAEQREALALRILEGFTLSEVAAVMGKRTGTVKALQRRGITRLRHLLAQ
jgi:RNA polymerase sigma factor (sigma-70 family)